MELYFIFCANVNSRRVLSVNYCRVTSDIKMVYQYLNLWHDPWPVKQRIVCSNPCNTEVYGIHDGNYILFCTSVMSGFELHLCISFMDVVNSDLGNGSLTLLCIVGDMLATCSYYVCHLSLNLKLLKVPSKRIYHVSCALPTPLVIQSSCNLYICTCIISIMCLLSSEQMYLFFHFSSKKNPR